MISVIIVTRNRPKQLAQCLRSLAKSTYKNYEIIVADQSDTFLSSDDPQLLLHKKTIYIPIRQVGKTKGSNIALQAVKGNIVSFIDDDNIVTRDWLYQINIFFATHPAGAVVFGKILPYQPNKHRNEISPACFFPDSAATITSPYTIFYKSIGLGSNMSIKKNIIRTIGGFKEWLGPGNYGFAGGEDGEYITRMLLHGITLYYNPNILVYHNRWLHPDDYAALTTKYTGGEVAYGIYFYLKGHAFFGRFARDTVLDKIRLHNIREYLTFNLNLFRVRIQVRRCIISIINIASQLYYALKGFSIGFYYATYEKYTKPTNSQP